jgi:hypothetical protein
LRTTERLTMVDFTFRSRGRHCMHAS